MFIGRFAGVFTGCLVSLFRVSGFIGYIVLIVFRMFVFFLSLSKRLF